MIFLVGGTWFQIATANCVRARRRTLVRRVHRVSDATQEVTCLWKKRSPTS